MLTPAENITSARKALAEADRSLRAQLKNLRGRARGKVYSDLWTVRRMLGAVQHYHSQFGQDWIIDTHLFKGKRNGVFVDIGGYDGVNGSNTLFFEQMRGWSGILVEPAQSPRRKALEVRRCECLNVAVAEKNGAAEFLQVDAGYTQMSGLIRSYDSDTLAQVRADTRHSETILTVPTLPLADILSDRGLHQVDYLSLDVEGGESAILNTFPFSDFEISAWSIENATSDPGISDIMRKAGYQLVEYLGFDEIYCRPDQLHDRPNN